MADAGNIAATARVLHTTELLESVLLHTNNKTLLTSQKVSRAFSVAIKGYVRLQQKLHLRQHREAKLMALSSSPAAAPEDVPINPLTAAADVLDVFEAYDNYHDILIAFPLQQFASTRLRFQVYTRYAASGQTVTPTLAATSHAEASWRRMYYLSAPPAASVEARVRVFSGGGKSIELYIDAGMTVGEIMDEAMRLWWDLSEPNEGLGFAGGGSANAEGSSGGGRWAVGR